MTTSPEFNPETHSSNKKHLNNIETLKPKFGNKNRDLRTSDHDTHIDGDTHVDHKTPGIDQDIYKEYPKIDSKNINEDLQTLITEMNTAIDETKIPKPDMTEKEKTKREKKVLEIKKLEKHLTHMEEQLRLMALQSMWQSKDNGRQNAIIVEDDTHVDHETEHLNINSKEIDKHLKTLVAEMNTTIDEIKIPKPNMTEKEKIKREKKVLRIKELEKHLTSMEELLKLMAVQSTWLSKDNGTNNAIVFET